MNNTYNQGQKLQWKNGIVFFVCDLDDEAVIVECETKEQGGWSRHTDVITTNTFDGYIPQASNTYLYLPKKDLTPYTMPTKKLQYGHCAEGDVIVNNRKYEAEILKITPAGLWKVSFYDAEEAFFYSWNKIGGEVRNGGWKIKQDTIEELIEKYIKSICCTHDGEVGVAMKRETLRNFYNEAKEL